MIDDSLHDKSNIDNGFTKVRRQSAAQFIDKYQQKFRIWSKIHHRVFKAYFAFDIKFRKNDDTEIADYVSNQISKPSLRFLSVRSGPENKLRPLQRRKKNM